MSEFVGVRTIFAYVDTNLLPTLKQEALLVDRIAIPSLLDGLYSNKIPDRHQDNIRELRWLFEQGLIFEVPNIYVASLTEVGEVKTQLDRQEQLRQDLVQRRTQLKSIVDYRQVLPNLTEYAVLTARLAAVYLRRKLNIDAYAWDTVSPDQSSSVPMDTVLNITLKNLPMPDEHTPWEQIMEYRSDPDSTGKFLALRNWMRDTSKLNLSPREIEDKLEYLISEHERHMRIHRMKMQRSALETLVVTPAELLENLVKIKWSEAAKKMFSLKENHISLMEAELSSPGREIAYILKARDTF